MLVVAAKVLQLLGRVIIPHLNIIEHTTVQGGSASDRCSRIGSASGYNKCQCMRPINARSSSPMITMRVTASRLCMVPCCHSAARLRVSSILATQVKNTCHDKHRQDNEAKRIGKQASQKCSQTGQQQNDQYQKSAIQKHVYNNSSEQ